MEMILQKNTCYRLETTNVKLSKSVIQKLQEGFNIISVFGA